MNFTDKLRIVFVGAIICVSGAVSAFDAQMLEEQCTKFSRNFSEHKSEACPNLTVINTCVSQTGYFGFDLNSDIEYQAFAEFGIEKLASCKQACEDDDLGACYIYGYTLTTDASGYISYAGAENRHAYQFKFDNLEEDFEGYTYITSACEGGIADACRDAATFAELYWLPLRDHPAAIKKEFCSQEDTSKYCLREREKYGLADENNWFTESPMEFYIQGCELDDAKSCKQAFEFATRFPDLVGGDIDPEFYRKRACDIGIKLFKCE